MKDTEFIEWLMQYQSTCRYECQKNVVANAIKAMGDSRPFGFWVHAEYLRLRLELFNGFPFTDHLVGINLSREGTAMGAIKNKWDEVVIARTAEFNQPKGAGKNNG